MKAKAPKPNWYLDDYWFIHYPQGFFHICQLDLISLENSSLVLYVANTRIACSFPNLKDRDGVYKMLVGAKQQVVKQNLANSKKK